MATPLKLMTFNILNGGGDEARFASVIDVIRRVSPDLLVLQECLEWQADGTRFKAVSEALGIPAEPSNARLSQSRTRGSGKRFHLGVFSRNPILDCQVHNQAAFLGHSLAHVKIDWAGQVLNLIGAHFDSKNENLRYVEARYLRSILDPADFKKGLYALAGDLNSLSRNDPYPAELEAMLRQSMTTKYHLPPRFEVMEELAEFGWVDGLYLKPPTRWITAPRNRGGVHIDYRTDYLLFSASLAQRVAQVEVVPTHQESDHHPLQAVLF